MPTFTAGNWPGACWRPYSDASPFNQEIPANPRLHPELRPDRREDDELGQGPSDITAGVADTGSDWSHPLLNAKPTDPVYTVHCTRSWGACEVEGMQVHIPSAARAAGGGDGHMAVIDAAEGWEYDFWQVVSKPAGGGTVTVNWGGRTRIGTPDADGLGSDATAAHFGLAAGIIRGPEMQAGVIRHAIFMVAKCDSGEKVFPAEGVGSKCSDGAADAPAEGARLQLALNDGEIQALPVPAWKKTILAAMAHYGLFVGDTGGSPWDIWAESGSSYTSFGAPDPWVSFAKSAGVPESGGGRYYFDVASDVDWASHLRVIDPCVTEQTCCRPRGAARCASAAPAGAAPSATSSRARTSRGSAGRRRPAASGAAAACGSAMAACRRTCSRPPAPPRGRARRCPRRGRRSTGWAARAASSTSREAVSSRNRSSSARARRWGREHVCEPISQPASSRPCRCSQDMQRSSSR